MDQGWPMWNLYEWFLRDLYLTGGCKSRFKGTAKNRIKKETKTTVIVANIAQAELPIERIQLHLQLNCNCNKNVSIN